MYTKSTNVDIFSYIIVTLVLISHLCSRHIAEILPSEENSTPKEHRFSEDSMDSALNSVNPSSPSCQSSTEYRTSGSAAYYRNSLPSVTTTSNTAPILRRLSSNSAGNSSYYEVNRHRLQRRIEGTIKPFPSACFPCLLLEQYSRGEDGFPWEM